MVLTGTPIQNDLDELFSLVNFVSPGFLGLKRQCYDWKGFIFLYFAGSLPQFKSLISGPISLAREVDSTFLKNVPASTDEWGIVAKAEKTYRSLQCLINQIMLRRTQSDILRGMLPPRTDVTVLCKLSPSQQRQYDDVADELMRELRITRCISSDETCDDEEATEDNHVCHSALVLPVLIRLRKLCIAAERVEENEINEIKKDVATKPGEEILERHLLRSSKLQVFSQFVFGLIYCNV